MYVVFDDHQTEDNRDELVSLLRESDQTITEEDEDLLELLDNWSETFVARLSFCVVHWSHEQTPALLH